MYIVGRHTDVCAINEAEQIEKRDSGNNVKINFHQELGLCLRVELNKWTSISLTMMSTFSRGEKENDLLVCGQMATLCRGAETFHLIVMKRRLRFLLSRSISRTLRRSGHSFFLDIVVRHPDEVGE